MIANSNECMFTKLLLQGIKHDVPDVCTCMVCMRCSTCTCVCQAVIANAISTMQTIIICLYYSDLQIKAHLVICTLDITCVDFKSRSTESNIFACT